MRNFLFGRKTENTIARNIKIDIVNNHDLFNPVYIKAIQNLLGSEIFNRVTDELVKQWMYRMLSIDAVNGTDTQKLQYTELRNKIEAIKDLKEFISEILDAQFDSLKEPEETMEN